MDLNLNRLRSRLTKEVVRARFRVYFYICNCYLIVAIFAGVQSTILYVITRHIDDLRTRSTPVHLHWIPAHTNIIGIEEADVAAKEATGWRMAKRRKENGESGIPDTRRKDTL